jgi:hypothetical protein
MKASFQSIAISDHFVDANKMVEIASKPCSRSQENGRFDDSKPVEFDGIKPLEFERFRITATVLTQP